MTAPVGDVQEIAAKPAAVCERPSPRVEVVRFRGDDRDDRELFSEVEKNPVAVVMVGLEGEE